RVGLAGPARGVLWPRGPCRAVGVGHVTGEAVARPGDSARRWWACMLASRGCASPGEEPPGLVGPPALILLASAGQPRGPLAQSAERLHGKEKVYGSIP